MATLTDVLLSGSYDLALRALVLTGTLDGVLAEVPGDVLEGSVDMDRTRELPRMASVVVDNSRGLYTPVNTTSLTWPNRIWRLERGAVINGVAQYLPLITGLLSEPGQSVGSKSVPFTLTSRLALLNQNFTDAMVYLAGTRLAAVVRSVCQLAGLGLLDNLYVLNDGGRALTADRAVDSSANMLAFLVGLCRDNGLDLGDDALGRTTLAPWVDPSTAPVQWTFDATADAITLDVQRKLRAPAQVFNRAIVVGVGPDHYPVEAQARDLNPLSPTYNPPDGSGPIGDRPQRYTSSDIHDQAAANQVALRRLYDGALYQEPADLVAVPLPGVEHRHVARIKGAGVDGVRLLDKVTMPLGAGNMGLATVAVRSLIAP